MKRKPRSQKLVAEINITPFTDVILVLLIIFMVATPLIVQSSTKIQLPKADSKQQNNAPEGVNVIIDASGEISLNSKHYNLKLDSEFLKFQLKSLLKKSSDGAIIISADKNVRYDFVMKVIDLASGVGFQQVVLVSQVQPCASSHCQ